MFKAIGPKELTKRVSGERRPWALQHWREASRGGQESGLWGEKSRTKGISGAKRRKCFEKEGMVSVSAIERPSKLRTEN